MRAVIRKTLNKQLRKNRSRAKIFGTATRPRLSVFRSNKFTSVQLIDDFKGKTLVSASTRGMKSVKGKVAAAKNLGAQIGEAAKKLGIKEAVFHKGPYQYHGRVSAVADGAREAGLKI